MARIEQDGAMQRRRVDTAQRDDGPGGKTWPPRALASPPPSRPVPGPAVYHISVDDHLVQAGEYDLGGPPRGLVAGALAMGDDV